MTPDGATETDWICPDCDSVWFWEDRPTDDDVCQMCRAEYDEENGP